MNDDPKRELLRHMVATVLFRGRIAIANTPPDFAEFRVTPETRSPAEILAHIGDLLVGTRVLLQGDLVELRSSPLEWNQEGQRFFAAAKELDAFLASDTPLALIGEDALCERYVRALDVLGVGVSAKLENTAPRGLFQLAFAAGLVPPLP